MCSSLRSALVAAASLASLEAAHAGFVYQSAQRSVTASIASTTDSGSTTSFGTWFDSASVFGGGSAASATHGSDLAALAMSFSGGAQAVSGAAGGVSALSLADITFLANSLGGGAALDVEWLVALSEDAAGSTSSSVSFVLTDLTTGTMRVMLGGDNVASGTISLVAGNLYRLEVRANASGTGSGNALANYNVNFSVIPVPGAMSLLVLAGFVGFGRRSRRSSGPMRASVSSSVPSIHRETATTS